MFFSVAENNLLVWKISFRHLPPSPIGLSSVFLQMKVIQPNVENVLRKQHFLRNGRVIDEFGEFYWFYWYQIFEWIKDNYSQVHTSQLIHKAI